MGTFARVNGADLFYETVGEGEPILMMHGGLGLDHTYLRPGHDPLAGQARLIYYDHRWNGRSERIGEPDHAMWDADAAALLDHLGANRATIYGHSYGAWLALGFALRYPARVSRLILCGASPAFDYPPDLARGEREHPAAVAALIAGLQAPPVSDEAYGELWHTILPLYFDGVPPAGLLAKVRFSVGGYVRGSAALAGFSVVDQLRALAMPIRILAGAADFITPLAQAHRIAEHAPDVRITELGASGHFPFVEEPAAYLDAMRGFLAGR